ELLRRDGPDPTGNASQHDHMSPAYLENLDLRRAQNPPCFSSPLPEADVCVLNGAVGSARAMGAATGGAAGPLDEEPIACSPVSRSSRGTEVLQACMSYTSL